MHEHTVSGRGCAPSIHSRRLSCCPGPLADAAIPPTPVTCSKIDLYLPSNPNRTKAETAWLPCGTHTCFLIGTCLQPEGVAAGNDCLCVQLPPVGECDARYRPICDIYLCHWPAGLYPGASIKSCFCQCLHIRGKHCLDAMWKASQLTPVQESTVKLLSSDL